MVNVGVDLHKSQFTVFWRRIMEAVLRTWYTTSEASYRRFKRWSRSMTGKKLFGRPVESTV